MADNLESYFKKKLSEDKPGEGDWNVPSDKVWEKVLPEIQKKRGLFIPWKYFYLAGILLLAGLIFLFWFIGTPEENQGADKAPEIVGTEQTFRDSPSDAIKNTTKTDGEEIARDQAEASAEKIVFGENQKDFSGNKTVAGAETDSRYAGGITSTTSGGNSQTGNKVITGFMRISEELTPVSNEVTPMNKKKISKISTEGEVSVEERDFMNQAGDTPLRGRNEPINNKGKFSSPLLMRQL